MNRTHTNDTNYTEEENVSATVKHSEEQNVTTSSVELSENLNNDHDKIYNLQLQIFCGKWNKNPLT